MTEKWTFFGVFTVFLENRSPGESKRTVHPCNGANGAGFFFILVVPFEYLRKMKKGKEKEEKEREKEKKKEDLKRRNKKKSAPYIDVYL